MITNLPNFPPILIFRDGLLILRKAKTVLEDMGIQPFDRLQYIRFLPPLRLLNRVTILLIQIRLAPEPAPAAGRLN